MKKMFWFLLGIVSVKWVSPIIESFMRTIVAYNGLIIQDIGREDQKSQSIIDAEFPQKEMEFVYLNNEDYDDE